MKAKDGLPLRVRLTEGLGLGMELRHEWNVCRTDVEAHLRKESGDLTSVVRLVIEHVRYKRPPWDRSSLAINLACVGKRLS